MKYKVILFDADGVTLKSAHLFSEQIQIDYGIKTETLQPFFNGIFKQCTIGKADLKEELVKVIGEWGWKGTVEELMEYWFTKGTHVDEDVDAYVRSLRDQGVRCFMTTDQEKYRGEYLNVLLGNGKVFEQVFYSAEIGHVKKEPEYFEHVYQVLSEIMGSIDKNEILFIDDGEKNVEAAKIFGLDGYFYRNLDELKMFLSKNE